MADKRNRVIELTNYLESLGIVVNIGKNKARGNRGIFCRKNGTYRIDISKNMDEETVLATLIHEFAHYVHYKYDKTLKSLEFVFGVLTEEEQEELLNVTVNNIPKEFAASLYKIKEEYTAENKILLNKIRKIYPDFKVSEPNKKIERSLMFAFSLSELQASYIKLKSNQKNISKINARINKLNKYYNQPSELWARFCEMFFIDYELANQIAPAVSAKLLKVMKFNNIPEMSEIQKIFF